MSDGDRRAPGATRIPFEATVEVGGALGPSFEAQSIDVSDDGMHLRTAYLPEVGQPLTCRFYAGPGDGVLVAGEVVWARDASRGGEFGLRFTDLDGLSAAALRRITAAVGLTPDTNRNAVPPTAHAGSKVRLHIDGLGSPMRARVKGANRAELAVGSELGFLRIGKQLELEDADTGAKRPARIDRVEVEVDPESHVPQLVVSLRYADENDEISSQRAPHAEADGYEDESSAAVDAEAGSMDVDVDAPSAHAPTMMHETNAGAAGGERAPSSNRDLGDDEEDDIAAFRGASGRMKTKLVEGASKFAPTLRAFATRARTTMAIVAANRFRAKKDEAAAPVRRVTAPPPVGGLHATGRKVVRDSIPDHEPPKPEGKTQMLVKKIGTRRAVVGAGAIAICAMAIGFAMHKSSASAAAAAAAATAGAAAGETAAADPAAAPANGAVAANGATSSGAIPPTEALPTSMPVATAGTGGITPPASGPAPTDGTSTTTAASDEGDRSEHKSHKKVLVPPFTNGGMLAHGTVLRIKMDGAIEKIQGAPQTTGFTVVIPNRRSLEPAAPLAARDGRIASIKVTNDPSGAELALAFKDGVPNYMVRARGDYLEVVLAPLGGAPTASQATSKEVASTASPVARERPTAKRKHPAHVKR